MILALFLCSYDRRIFLKVNACSFAIVNGNFRQIKIEGKLQPIVNEFQILNRQYTRIEKIKCRYLRNNHNERRDERSKKNNNDNITCKIKVDVSVSSGMTPNQN